ncbi:MAG: ribosome maturation factor RimM [Nitrospinota bacterium]
MVALGRFLKPHGVNGELKFDPYLPNDADPGDISRGLVKSSPGNEEREIIIASGRAAGRLWLLRPDGVNSPEEAAGFTNREFWIKRSQLSPLPEGEYFSQDIMGCGVIDEDDNEIGVVDDVIQTGANDVWQIARTGGGEVLIPVIPEVVRNVDVENRKIVVRLMDGLSD